MPTIKLPDGNSIDFPKKVTDFLNKVIDFIEETTEPL